MLKLKDKDRFCPKGHKVYSADDNFYCPVCAWCYPPQELKDKGKE